MLCNKSVLLSYMACYYGVTYTIVVWAEIQCIFQIRMLCIAAINDLVEKDVEYLSKLW